MYCGWSREAAVWGQRLGINPGRISAVPVGQHSVWHRSCAGPGGLINDVRAHRDKPKYLMSGL